MAIKPIENKQGKSVLIKIFFLTVLIVTGFIFNLVISGKKNELKSTPEVLSVNDRMDDLKKKAGNTLNDALKTAENLTGEVLGEATDLTSEIASESGKIITDFIFSKATEPIIDQINNLPMDKREEIKKNICQ